MSKQELKDEVEKILQSCFVEDWILSGDDDEVSISKFDVDMASDKIISFMQKLGVKSEN